MNKIFEIISEIIRLKEVKNIAENIAIFTDIKPDAIGLYFFIGCFLSSFMSNESFKR